MTRADIDLIYVHSARRIAAFAVGSNAGGGGGWSLEYLTPETAEAGAAVFRSRGADPRCRGRYVEVPDAACVIQRDLGGPIDGDRWPGAEELARAVLALPIAYGYWWHRWTPNQAERYCVVCGEDHPRMLLDGTDLCVRHGRSNIDVAALTERVKAADCAYALAVQILVGGLRPGTHTAMVYPSIARVALDVRADGTVELPRPIPMDIQNLVDIQDPVPQLAGAVAEWIKESTGAPLVDVHQCWYKARRAVDMDSSMGIPNSHYYIPFRAAS